jgi:hypothetical protein
MVVSSGLDPWAGQPSFVQIWDSFDDSILSTLKWGTKVEVGSTTISESGGNLVITNTGVGTKGISYLPSRLTEFGRFQRISADITLTVGSVVGDGEHAEASLVLYKDSNNWIRIGPYRDTSEAINTCIYLRTKIAGVVGNQVLSASPADTNEYVYTIALTAYDIFIYLSGVELTGFEWNTLIGYQVWLEAGTTADADKITATFDDFEVYHDYDTAMITVGKLVRATYDKVGTIETDVSDLHTDIADVHTDVGGVSSDLAAAKVVIDDTYALVLAGGVGSGTFTAVSGTLSLPNTTAVELEFDAATYGTVFRPVVAFGITGAYVDYCKLYSSAAYTDYDTEAGDMISGDTPLQAPSGAAVNDIIWFGLSEISHRLNCVISGGRFNVDTVFDWVYWDGAAAQLLAGVSDGTRRETVVHDCEAAWDETVDADVTVTTSAGVVGTNCNKLAVAAGAGTNHLLATDNVSSMNLSSYTFIDVWLKSSVNTAAGDLKLLLDDTASCVSALESIAVPALTANTWTRCRLKLATPANDTAIISVGLYQVTDLGAFDLYVDDVRAVTREFTRDGAVTWTTDVTSQTLDSQAAFWVGARIYQVGTISLGTYAPVGSYFPFSSDAGTDFDTLAMFFSKLYVSVYRKIGAAYPLRPDDVFAFQQSNLRKNASVDVLCYSDTKVVFQLSDAPDDTISVPYQGTVNTLKT